MATNSNPEAGESSNASMSQPTSEPQPQPEPSASSSPSTSEPAPAPTPASTSPPPRKCAHCSVVAHDHPAPDTDPGEGISGSAVGDKLRIQLKPCPKCHTALYCSRDCQKAAFKKHKKTCAVHAQEYARTANLKMAAPSGPKKDGWRGGLQKWQFDT
ncbi:hypothetical protein LARI1_G006556 [Lachnellula arida]|uniref:MYND-type domain-containing protein n=1 Tax=Lachnellula arida TaxID=1316785 RepID=A0A8T9B3E3_9HELO|nr:hypothetical protein LARI1_G006556 [Lachnellula arida]